MRSPSPRRRRRHQAARDREAREKETRTREKNRERWMVKAPWKKESCTSSWATRPKRRNVAADEDMVEVPVEAEGVTGGSSGSNPARATGGTAASTLPTVGQAGPSVRFWSNMTGLTDPMCDEDDDGPLIPEGSEDNIAYNLQQMGDRERADAYLGLIQFLAMFMAELMKAISRANGPDVIVLLQGQMELHPGNKKGEDGEQDTFVLVQTTGRQVPATAFGSQLAALQTHLNSMSERMAGETARRLLMMLESHHAELAVSAGIVVTDRIAWRRSHVKQ